jgi:hypothetical protein
MVPVTSLRPVTVSQPVVTYYYPPAPACCPTTSPMAPASGPTVEQLRERPPAVVPPAASSDMIPPPNVPATPSATPYSFPRTNPNGTPRIRPDKTTSRSGSVVTVRGEVVMPDQLTPRAGAKLVFMNAANRDVREYATANQYGEFDVKIPAGNWYVYLAGADGRAVYHKQVNLGDRETYDYKVVSR